MLRLLVSAVFALGALASPAGAATPDNGTLTPGAPVLNYSGGPFFVSNPSGANGDDPDCSVPTTCDDYTLTVDVPAGYDVTNPDDVVIIQVDWTNDLADFDVYVFQGGTRVTESATGGHPEVIVLPAEDAVYTIRTVSFAVAGDSYDAVITLGPPSPSGFGDGIYVASDDVFTCNTHLTGVAGVFSHDGDAEPGTKFTPDGRAYVASLGGVGAGIGFWRVTDVCAQEFTFLDQPDAGVGGGDTDIVIGSKPNALGFHNIYTSSLTLANVTSSTSLDNGETFIPTVVSDVTPINDRQWNAAYDSSTVCLSYRTLNTGNQLFVVRSDLSGLPGTWVGPFLVYSDVVVDANLNTQLGNMVFDRRPIPGASAPFLSAGPDGEGTLYHGFTLAGSNVYVAVSQDLGVTWTSRLVWEGPVTDDYAHVFTWVAVDDAGNVYTCFSDNTNSYYSVSQDQGVTWSRPIRINNGAPTKTSVFPTMAAGSEGKIVVSWYGSPGTGVDDPANQWRVFHARCENALDPIPVFEQVEAGDHVIKFGPICLDGLNCSGNRELLENFEIDVSPLDGSSFIAYSDAALNGGTNITRQVAGKSAYDGLTILDRSQICPTPDNGCAVSPPPEGRCSKPGETVANDASGDFTALGTTQHDILRLGIAEPFFGIGVDKIQWILNVAELDPDNLPPLTVYYILFTAPNGTRYWVSMETCDVTQIPSFSYGTLDPTLGFQTLGDADDGQVFADGTICITISDSLVGNLKAGDVLTNIVADVRVFAGAQCSGLVSQVDMSPAGVDTLTGGQPCEPVPVYLSGFEVAETSGGVELRWRSVSDAFTVWKLYRSDHVLENWTRITEPPVPAGIGEFSFRDDPPALKTWYYRITGVLRTGEEILLSDAWVELGPGRGYALAAPGGNPFQGSTRISFTLPREEHVRIQVFSVAGELVRTLVDETMPAGTHVVSLDMNGGPGRPLSSGVYLVRARAGNWSKAMQVVALN